LAAVGRRQATPIPRQHNRHQQIGIYHFLARVIDRQETLRRSIVPVMACRSPKTPSQNIKKILHFINLLLDIIYCYVNIIKQ
jgi:hypothetical protein